MPLAASKAGAAVLGLAGLGLIGYMLTRQEDAQYGGGSAGVWTPASPSIVTPWKDLLDPGTVTFPTPTDTGGVSMLYPMLQYAPAPVDYSGVEAGDKKGTVLLADFLTDPAPTPLPSLPGLPDIFGAVPPLPGLPDIFGAVPAGLGLLGFLAPLISMGNPLIGVASFLGQVAGQAAGQQIFGQPKQPTVNLPNIMQEGTGSLYFWAPQPDGSYASVGSIDLKKGTATATATATAAPQYYASPEVEAFAITGNEPQENVVVKKGQIVSAGSAGSSEPRGIYTPSNQVYSAPGTSLGGSSGSVMSSKSATILSGDSPSAVAWRAKYGGG